MGSVLGCRKRKAETNVINTQNIKSTKLSGNWNALLLFNGYIRELQLIIPVDILKIMCNYYGSINPHIIYYLNSTNNLRRIDLGNTSNKSNIKIAYDWNEKDNSITSILNKICFKSNVKFDNNYYNKNDRFNVIFRFVNRVYYSFGDRIYDYSSGRLNALIWNINDTNLKNVRSVELPKNPLYDKYFHPNCSRKTPYGQSIIYSNKQQCLFTIGDTRNQVNFFKLSFNEYIINDTINNYNLNGDVGWKWSKMKYLMPKNRSRGIMSLILIENDDFNEQLICIGGHNGGSKYVFVDLYNFETNKWSKLENLQTGSRDSCGLYYDKINKKIYCGGGDGGSDSNHFAVHTANKMEYLNLYKNKWYLNIPNTNNDHTYNPLIWISNNNLLHIMSLSSNLIEFIDLRTPNKSWNMLDDSLQSLFHLDYLYPDSANNCRIFK